MAIIGQHICCIRKLNPAPCNAVQVLMGTKRLITNNKELINRHFECMSSVGDSQDSVIFTVTRRLTRWSRSWFLAEAQDFSRLQNSQTSPGSGPMQLLYNTYQGIFPQGKSDRAVGLTTHYIVPLRMSGAIPPLSLYAFMACIGTPILFVIFQYRKFHTVMHEKYTLYVTSHFTRCMYTVYFCFN
jgi:hypothetical protein